MCLVTARPRVVMVTGAEAVIRLEVEDLMETTGADEVKVTGFNDTLPTIELFSPRVGRSYYEDQGPDLRRGR